MAREQNAMFAITTTDENGKKSIAYVPISVNEEMLDYILKNCICNDKKVILFDREVDQNTFWQGVWQDLLSYCDEE